MSFNINRSDSDFNDRESPPRQNKIATIKMASMELDPNEEGSAAEVICQTTKYEK